MTTFRNIRKDEWLHAWHYARYDRRHNQIPEHVGPLLRQAAKAVMRQGRDVLAVRAAMQRVHRVLVHGARWLPQESEPRMKAPAKKQRRSCEIRR